MVTHSAVGAKGPGFNSPIARAYLSLNSRASTLAGKSGVSRNVNCEGLEYDPVIIGGGSRGGVWGVDFPLQVMGVRGITAGKLFTIDMIVHEF